MTTVTVEAVDVDGSELVQAFAFSSLISYRTLDYWTRKGYLRAAVEGGTGHARFWHRDEVAVAAATARIATGGIPPATGSRIARSGPGTTSLCEGLTVTAAPNLWATGDLPLTHSAAKRMRLLRELAGLE